MNKFKKVFKLFFIALLISPIPTMAIKLNVAIGKKEEVSGLGEFIQIWYNFIIGAVGIMATVMIMYAGIKWLTSRGNATVISDSKEKIFAALIGLTIAFLSYTILALINPNLLTIGLTPLPGVDVNLIEYERRAASGISGGRGTGAGNYQGGTPSAELQNFANNLQGTNDIDTILVRANNVRGTSSVSFTDDNGNTITVPAEIGANGVATDGGTEGDQRTPTGSYQILDNSRIATGTNDAVYTLNGQSNMGSAFVNTNISTSDGRNRGIGFHGSGNNTLRPTNGCIRVSNETLEQLAPHMTPGTVVIIQ